MKYSLCLFFDKCKRSFYYVLAIILRKFTSVKHNQVFCWSYGGDKYACNPRAITEYLLENAPEYNIYWAFDKSYDASKLDKRINVVRKYSFLYLYALYTSKFVFHNARNNQYQSMFIKKKEQKYIMTWHGPFALKKIEKDAQDKLSYKYIRNATLDSIACDLMLSNSKFFTNLIHNSFWYSGDILEKCSPRNDVFYDNTKKEADYKNVRKLLGVDYNCKLILYAPTFRGNGKDLDYYLSNWDHIIPYFEKLWDNRVEVLLRLHPNISNMKGIEKLILNSRIHNVTNAPDITEYLFAADAMISDYTSAMFDFSILRKPCFIYAIDKDEYDRGFYWSFNQLPFPFAENEMQLIENVKCFNNDEYLTKLDKFIADVWGLEEDGKACKRIYEWMVGVQKWGHQ